MLSILKEVGRNFFFFLVSAFFSFIVEKRFLMNSTYPYDYTVNSFLVWSLSSCWLNPEKYKKYIAFDSHAQIQIIEFESNQSLFEFIWNWI